jgi:hypothetical protein
MTRNMLDIEMIIAYCLVCNLTCKMSEMISMCPITSRRVPNFRAIRAVCARGRGGKRKANGRRARCNGPRVLQGTGRGKVFALFGAPAMFVIILP